MINRLARLKLHIKFQQSPVISISDTTGPLNEVFFPSVTVCNLNQVWLNADESLFFLLKPLQIRMSQVYRLGFKDMTRDSHVARMFIEKYLVADVDASSQRNYTQVLGQNSNEEKLKSENKHFHHIASF